MEDKATIAESVLEHAKEYAKANMELAKLEAINKGSEFASTAISYILAVATLVMCGLILNVAVALLIGDLLGKLYLGFFIVAGFYMLLSFIMFVGHKVLVVRPVNSMAIRSYLKNMKKNEKIQPA